MDAKFEQKSFGQFEPRRQPISKTTTKNTITKDHLNKTKKKTSFDPKSKPLIHLQRSNAETRPKNLNNNEKMKNQKEK